MKVFEKEGKINFIDDNNVLIGFSIEKDCCESPGWHLATSPRVLEAEKIDPEGFQFDTAYCDEWEHDHLEEGGAVTFKLIKDEKVIYLILTNVHNGYYGHGFDMTKDGQKLFDGYI